MAFFILDVVGELDLTDIEERIHGKDARGARPYRLRMMVALLLYTEKRLEEEARALLERAAAKDADDDQRFGEGQDDEDLPAELQLREDRLERIRAAKVGLEAEVRKAAVAHKRKLGERCRERARTSETAKNRRLNETTATKREAEALDDGQDDDDGDPPFTSPEGLPMHRPRHARDGTPHSSAQANLTDPLSRIMKSGGAFTQGYNCQADVDGAAQIIVGQAVSNQAPDEAG